MPSNKRASDRRWDFFFVDKRSGDICMGSSRLTPEEALKRVEGYEPGALGRVGLEIGSARGVKRGTVLHGRYFLLVCTG
jgi:hypothetical protein